MGIVGNTGSILSLVLLGRGWRGGVTQMGEVDRVKEEGRPSSPSASWAENTIIAESTQESGHRQSMYSLVCGVGYAIHAVYES